MLVPVYTGKERGKKKVGETSTPKNKIIFSKEYEC